MTHLVALLLGSIQGLTEFFPISSSAHLKMAQSLLGISENPLSFDLHCHLGSLAALIWFFKKDIRNMLNIRKGDFWLYFLALLPLIPSYFFLDHVRKFFDNPRFLGFFLIGTSIILFLGHSFRLPKLKKNIVRDVLLIGLMQSTALFPGISRSASTISCATVLGWNAKKAVRFSFMLAIPTILGGHLLEMKTLWEKGKLIELINLDALLGFAAAFVVGLAVIHLAIPFLEKGKLKPFAWYCLFIGTIASFTLT